MRSKKKYIALYSILKTLCIGELNHQINGGKVHLKSFPGSKAIQLNHHTIPILEEHQSDAAAIHVRINDLLSRMFNNVTVTVDSICNDIFEIALHCHNHNIGEVFISSVAYSSKVNHELIQQLNDLLYKGCIEHGYNFIDNGAILTTDPWIDRIHLELDKQFELFFWYSDSKQQESQGKGKDFVYSENSSDSLAIKII